jgi:hypothetical protein
MISSVAPYPADLDMVSQSMATNPTTIFKLYLDSVSQEFRAIGAIVVHEWVKDMNSRITNVLALLIGLLMSPALCAQSDEAKFPVPLLTAIGKIAPKASVVRPQDIDGQECDSIGASPGIVRADFNGDGRQDYATILKTKVSEKETVWEGKTLREAQFALVLFLDDGRGAYRAISAYKYVGFVPTIGIIYPQSNREVRNRETHRIIRLANAAVTLAFCGKSATTYYITKDKIRSIPIAD